MELRLATCLRRQKGFTEAEKLVLASLKDRPQSIDAQIEAAAARGLGGGVGSAARQINPAIPAISSAAKTPKASSSGAGSALPTLLGTAWPSRLRTTLIWSRNTSTPDITSPGADFSRRSLPLKAKSGASCSTPLAPTFWRRPCRLPSWEVDRTWEKFNRLYREVQQARVNAGPQKEAVTNQQRTRRSPDDERTASRERPLAPDSK